MNIPEQEIEQPEWPSREGAVQRFGSSALPLVADQDLAIQFVRRYVEGERRRNRRILIWTSAVFLFVVVLVLATFVSVGIFVLRSSQRAADVVDDLRAKTALYASEVVTVSEKLSSFKKESETVKSTLEDAEVQRAREGQLLQSDLKRFGEWVDRRNAGDRQTIALLEARIRRMEELAIARESERASGREQRTDTRVTQAPTAADRGEDASTTLRGTASTAEIAASPAVGPARAAGAVVAREEKEGNSVVTFSNGDRYEGDFKDGLFSGWGIYSYKKGDRYEGEFRNDMKEGRGAFIFQNGDRYSGDFKNDMMDGKGTMVYHDGNRYTGDFRRGVRNGYGVLTFRNGDVYTGEFTDDVRGGRGSYVFKDGARYTGEFRNGSRHGQGRYVYPGGEEYVGEFRDGRREGMGECVYPGGERLKGMWEADKLVRVVEPARSTGGGPGP